MDYDEPAANRALQNLKNTSKTDKIDLGDGILPKCQACEAFEKGPNRELYFVVLWLQGKVNKEVIWNLDTLSSVRDIIGRNGALSIQGGDLTGVKVLWEEQKDCVQFGATKDEPF